MGCGECTATACFTLSESVTVDLHEGVVVARIGIVRRGCDVRLKLTGDRSAEHVAYGEGHGNRGRGTHRWEATGGAAQAEAAVQDVGRLHIGDHHIRITDEEVQAHVRSR